MGTKEKQLLQKRFLAAFKNRPGVTFAQALNFYKAAAAAAKRCGNG